MIDLRSEIYSMDYIRDYQRTEEVRAGWQDFLDRTKPGYALLKTKAPLTAALQEQLRWTTVGKDAGYVLLKAPDYSPGIRKSVPVCSCCQPLPARART